jgi:hypothetical protein
MSPAERPTCAVCGRPIHEVSPSFITPNVERALEGRWVHDKPYDPFAPPIHAPRPRGPITAADLIGDIVDGTDELP